MPNWCLNKLEIYFSAEQGEAVRQALFSTNESSNIELDFERLMPMPKELDIAFAYNDAEKLAQQYQHNIDNYGYKDWYDWSIANWGSKWNATSTIIFDESEEHLSLYFDSAWSPPESWFKALCAAFPDVDFTLSYYEPGCWFAGSMQSDEMGGCFCTEIDYDEVKQFAIDVFDEVFEEDEDE